MCSSRFFLGVSAFALMTGVAAAEELSIGLRVGGESMDPHVSAVGDNISAVRNVYETLVMLDPQLQTYEGLAESWETIDDTTWRFNLRQGVTFHDGSTFDAADVVASIARIPVAAGADSGLNTYIQRIADVTVIDDHTIQIKTVAPSPGLLLDLTRVFILPSEIDVATPVSDFNSGATAIGTGPFRMVSFTPKTELALEPFENYWGDVPQWDRVTITEINNDSSRVAALISGQVDLINAVPAGDMPRIESDGSLDIYRSPSIVLFIMFMDFRDETPLVYANDGSPLPSNPLQDLLVRRAISMAINREALASRIMEGNAVPANQFITEGFFGYANDLPDLAYDPEAARALLVEAGYPDGFRITINCTSDAQANDAATCAALGPMLTQIGLTVDVQAIPRAVYYSAQANFEYSLMMNGWGSQTGEGSYILSTAFHTRQEGSGFGGFNHYHYSNPEVDEAIELAANEMDAEVRRGLLEEAMTKAVEDLAAIPVVNLQTAWAGNGGMFEFTPRVDQETLGVSLTPIQ